MAFYNTLLTLFVLSLLACNTNGQLSVDYYVNTCQDLSSIVTSEMSKAVAANPRMGASILRLHFHDCFVNGCDGSVLLDGPNSEKTAPQNVNSLLGFSVIDTIKAKVEASCKSTVSCADILTLAARDGVVLLGGPTWPVLLGRKDSRTSNRNDANANLPLPSSSLSNMQNLFSSKGLNDIDLTALSGAHTIGFGQCRNFRQHIYNDKNIDQNFAKLRQRTCPSSGGDNNLAPIDIESALTFDNTYYTDLTMYKGLFHSDQELYNNGTVGALVNAYSTSQAAFFADFASAMMRMGNISPVTGNKGEIRLNCRKVN